jgi:hypothetical protein
MRNAEQILNDLEGRISYLERQASLQSRVASLTSDQENLVNELELYIVNDSKLYDMAQAIINNQARHMFRGRWTEAGSIKGFVNLVNAGIKSYRVAVYAPIPSRIPKAVKEEVARNLYTYYEDEINEEVENMA